MYLYGGLHPGNIMTMAYEEFFVLAHACDQYIADNRKSNP